MAISLIGTPQGGATDIDSTPLGTAIAVLAGDIVVLLISQNGFGTAAPSSYISAIVHGTFTATATITEVYGGVVPSRSTLMLAYYKVTGAGDLVVSANMDVTRSVGWSVSQWRGVDDDPVLGGTTVSNSGSSVSTFTGAAATPGKAGDVFVSFAVCNPPSFPTFTKTTDWTLVTKRDGVSDSYPSHIVEYREAVDTTPLTSAPTSTSSTNYRNTTIILNAAPEIIPGTTVARGLYL